MLFIHNLFQRMDDLTYLFLKQLGVECYLTNTTRNGTAEDCGSGACEFNGSR